MQLCFDCVLLCIWLLCHLKSHLNQTETLWGFFIGCTPLPPLWSSSTRHPGGDALIGALHTFFPSSSHFPPQCLLLTAAGTPPAGSDLTPPRSRRLNPAPQSWKSRDLNTNPDPMCHYIREFIVLSLLNLYCEYVTCHGRWFLPFFHACSVFHDLWHLYVEDYNQTEKHHFSVMSNQARDINLVYDSTGNQHCSCIIEPVSITGYLPKQRYIKGSQTGIHLYNARKCQVMSLYLSHLMSAPCLKGLELSGF